MLPAELVNAMTEGDTIIRDERGEPNDFIMTGDTAWITVDGHSLYLVREGGKLKIEWLLRYEEADDPIDTAEFRIFSHRS